MQGSIFERQKLGDEGKSWETWKRVDTTKYGQLGMVGKFSVGTVAACSDSVRWGIVGIMTAARLSLILPVVDGRRLLKNRQVGEVSGCYCGVYVGVRGVKRWIIGYNTTVFGRCFELLIYVTLWVLIYVT